MSHDACASDAGASSDVTRVDRPVRCRTIRAHPMPSAAGTQQRRRTRSDGAAA
ncbi:hypothetical protein Cus16_0258 [Curtobacterium sp. ER1/6]|nr:hypothetical protein Cus16_0258 [Curtobacterium sp. ER1/6]